MRLEDYLRAAEDGLHGVPAAPGHRSIEGEIAAVRTLVAISHDDPAQALVQGTTALSRLDHDILFLRGMVAMALGSVYLYQGDLARSVQTLGDVAASGRAAGNPYLALSLAAQQSYAQRVQGALHVASTTCSEAIQWSAQRGHPSPYVANVHLSLADLLREWNELEEARRHLGEATKLAPRWPGRLDFPVLCSLVQARITAAEGDAIGALAAVQAAKGQMRPSQASWEQDMLEAYEVQLWLAQGNLRAAVNWLQRREPEAVVARFRPSTPFYPWVHEHIDTAPVQVLLAQGRASGDPALLHRALALLKRRRGEAERVGRAWCQIKALTLQALVYDALGEEARSSAVLEEALTLAQPEGYVRVFADEGEPLAALLAAILRMRRSDGTQRSQGHAIAHYVNQLLAVMGRPANAVVDAPIPYGPDMSQPLLEPLSGRELDVLRLVAAGLSNREIAARLVIEVSTVKWYINSLFSKLEVDSRTRAVARARALGLITD